MARAYAAEPARVELATKQVAVASQSAFARDLQHAFADWQREVIEAMDQAGLGQAVPAFDPAWSTLFDPWRAFADAGSSRAPAGGPADAAGATRRTTDTRTGAKPTGGTRKAAR